MATDRKEMTCHDCDRTYSRPEHLKRHRLSHSLKSPHECPRCRRLFKRRDVLSRHLRTCSNRCAPTFVDYDRACQRCSSKKRKCGHEKPTCTGCRKAGHVCLYPIETSKRPAAMACSRLSDALRCSETESSKTNPKTNRMLLELLETEDLDMPPEESFDIRDNQLSLAAPTHQGFAMDMALHLFLPSLPPATSFTFLIQYTARYSLKGCFMTSSDAQILYSSPQPSASGSTCPELSSEVFNLSEWTNAVRSNSNGLEMSLVLNVEPPRKRLICDTTLQAEDRSSNQTYMPKLNTAWAIYSAIRRTILSDWSDVLEQRFLNFFSPGCVASALDLYWSIWHPNWPVIHRPTFSVEKSPLPLLAAMTVIGSCYINLEDARYWFDVVEDLVFNELQSTSNRQQPHRRVQNIQAAYLTCVYQTWEGGEIARTRIRRSRFRDIVTASRDLGIASIKHDVPADLEHFDWIRFIHVEESIRTLLWGVPPRYIICHFQQYAATLYPTGAAHGSGIMRGMFPSLVARRMLLHSM